LCLAGPTTLKQCEQDNGCPVVDHVKADVSMAFGWRQFNSTAPTDIRTPGIQRYINTMPNSLEEALQFGANTALPDTDFSEPRPDPDDPGDPGSSSEDSGTGGALPPCACTCEEHAANEAAAEEFKARIAAGEEPDMAEIAGFSRCPNACQREYMICIMEKDQENRAANEARREDRREMAAEDCDCSCAAMDEFQQKAKRLGEQFSDGITVSQEEIIRLTVCAQKCQPQHMACTTGN
jgi:hypothetical protein